MSNRTDNLEAISRAVGEILAEAEADIVSRRPVCRASGKCCRFEEYGHRLYVTGVELVHFQNTTQEIRNTKHETQNDARAPAVSLPQFFAGQPRGCPYQVEGLCTARAGRPLGCRVYFCDQDTMVWQHEVYEKYHAKLREVHEQFGLPYRYIEWRAGLREFSEGEVYANVGGEGGGNHPMPGDNSDVGTTANQSTGDQRHRDGAHDHPEESR